MVSTPVCSDKDRVTPGGDIVWDGQLSRLVFQLIQIIDYRLGNSGGSEKCDEKLELAILCFFRSFKRSYFLENGPIGGGMGGVPLDMMGMGGISLPVPGGEAPHPLLSLALSYSGDRKDAMFGGEAAAVSVRMKYNFYGYKYTSILGQVQI